MYDIAQGLPLVIDVRNPLKIGDVKVDNLGRQSQRYVGQMWETVINPATKAIVSVNSKSSRKAARPLKGPMKINVTVEELLFMIDELPLTPERAERIRKIRVDLADHLSPQEVDDIRDQCGEALQTGGFDAGYNATSKGMKLEHLIDVLLVD